MDLVTLHANRAERLEKVAFGMLGEVTQEYRRGLLSTDEFDELIAQYDTLTTDRVDARIDQMRAIDRERALVEFCHVRNKASITQHQATRLEVLHKGDESTHLPICTESLLHNSAPTHAPPRHLTTQSGAAQVIT